jgi:hypothetical protein
MLLLFYGLGKSGDLLTNNKLQGVDIVFFKSHTFHLVHRLYNPSAKYIHGGTHISVIWLPNSRTSGLLEDLELTG